MAVEIVRSLEEIDNKVKGLNKSLRESSAETKELDKALKLDGKSAVESALRSGTPVDTGNLAGSLTKADISTSKKYGYRLSYEGVDKYGTSLEKVANILNYGSSTIKPRKFVTKAIRKLKGLDDRAGKRFETKINTDFTE
ncbi:MAG: hypothetical protein LBQ27_06445 [Clostridiales bacterium]|jgi:HK97 gp10 family phage protein|nr:hypothetical protein [Clostridiales bacterium]